MAIRYAQEANLDVAEFKSVLVNSTLGERRPIEDEPRLEKILANSNLIVTARDDTGKLVGLARCVTDFALSCYCADLAVDKSYQGQGIGKQLLAKTTELAPEVRTFLLLSAPAAITFYEQAGYDNSKVCFIYHSNS